MYNFENICVSLIRFSYLRFIHSSSERSHQSLVFTFDKWSWFNKQVWVKEQCLLPSYLHSLDLCALFANMYFQSRLFTLSSGSVRIARVQQSVSFQATAYTVTRPTLKVRSTKSVAINFFWFSQWTLMVPLRFDLLEASDNAQRPCIQKPNMFIILECIQFLIIFCFHYFNYFTVMCGSLWQN